MDVRVGDRLPDAQSVQWGLVDAPAIVRVGHNEWQLYDDYVVQGSNFRLYLPARFLFNGASIPRVIRPVIGIWDLSVVAPLGHDAIYQFKGVLNPDWILPYRTFTRREADYEFHLWMGDEQVVRWRKQAGWTGVRAGGYFAFEKGEPYDWYPGKSP